MELLLNMYSRIKRLPDQGDLVLFARPPFFTDIINGFDILIISGDNPLDWILKFPEEPDIIVIIGLDNDIYDAVGNALEVEFDKVKSSMDDTFSFAGDEGIAIYTVDKSAKKVKINDVVNSLTNYILDPDGEVLLTADSYPMEAY